MNLKRTAVVVAFAAAAGCGLMDKPGAHLKRNQPPPPTPPSYSQYHLEGWQWDGVARVLVLPFLNESPYTRAGDEVGKAFCSELQRMGRFEVVAGPPDRCAELAAQIHRTGQFDEAIMLEIAKATQADVIVHGTITQYSPYPRPRIGLVFQAVSPQDAKVIASADGLWDSSDQAIAWRARTFYRQTPRERPPWIRNSVIPPDDRFAADLALDSPALYQRFVCHEVALTLLGLPVPGVAVGGEVMTVSGTGKHGRHGLMRADCAASPTGACPVPGAAPDR